MITDLAGMYGYSLGGGPGSGLALTQVSVGGNKVGDNIGTWAIAGSPGSSGNYTLNGVGTNISQVSIGLVKYNGLLYVSGLCAAVGFGINDPDSSEGSFLVPGGEGEGNYTAQVSTFSEGAETRPAGTYEVTQEVMGVNGEADLLSNAVDIDGNTIATFSTTVTLAWAD
jgi:hypothetical protein